MSGSPLLDWHCDAKQKESRFCTLSSTLTTCADWEVGFEMSVKLHFMCLAVRNKVRGDGNDENKIAYMVKAVNTVT